MTWDFLFTDDSLEMVQGWSGKWHIFESDLPSAPAQPASYYNTIAKPERAQALTTCGQKVMVKNRVSQLLYDKRRNRPRMCDLCRPVFLRRSSNGLDS